MEIKRLLPGALIAASACALPATMPSFQATLGASRASAPAPAAAALLPAPLARPAAHRTRRLIDYDEATDQTRVSLTTHPGKYFLWMQRPRITFFYVYPGATLEHAPATVFLVFKTHDPSAPSSNQLTLRCDGVAEAQALIPEFAFESEAFVTHRVFTFALPLPTFASLVQCRTPAVQVGDIGEEFSPAQVDALRDFAAGMRGPRRP